MLWNEKCTKELNKNLENYLNGGKVADGCCISFKEGNIWKNLKYTLRSKKIIQVTLYVRNRFFLFNLFPYFLIRQILNLLKSSSLNCNIQSKYFWNYFKA